MRIFISFGFILLMTIILGIFAITVADMNDDTGRIERFMEGPNAFSMGMTMGMLITLGLVMIPKGVWIGKNGKHN